VGGGYTGLSAALQSGTSGAPRGAGPKPQRVAFGASGRNGGQLGKRGSGWNKSLGKDGPVLTPPAVLGPGRRRQGAGQAS